MTGAIFVKFSQLFLMKIIKIVAIRCQILRLKCTKFNFGWSSFPDTATGSLQRSPRPLAKFKGSTSKGRGGLKRKWRVPSTFFCGWLAHAHGWLKKQKSLKQALTGHCCYALKAHYNYTDKG